MNYIKLTLSGVLQYFSDNNSSSLKGTYNTSLYPSKRSIIGMIASAFGYNRDCPKSKILYNELTMKYSIISNPIIINDFQSIKPLKSQKYYMNKYHTFDKFLTMNDDFSNKAIIKNISYLQDAEYEIFIGGSDELLESIYNALRNPTYSLFIGKRCCVPNKPIVTNFELIKEEDLQNVYDCA